MNWQSSKSSSAIRRAANKPPLVSVVLATFNRSNFCRAAIESLQSQTLDQIEIIVINDGSTDGTAEIVDACAARDSRIRPLHTPNRGISAARNLGVLLSRSELIACLDDDDIAFPYRLEKQYSFLKQHPGVGVVGGSMDAVDGKGVYLRHIHYPTDPAVIRKALLRGCPIGCPTAMVRRQLLIDVGGFRDVCRYAEDYDLWLRVSERTDLANLNEILVQYRWHGENATTQHRNSQALAGALARLAARDRRAGKPDPLNLVTRIDKSTLDLFELKAAERVQLLKLWVASQSENNRAK